MISEEYYLQLRPGGSILTVHCSQYDEVNNMYTFYLLYGNSRFNDNGYTAKVSGTKPDKKGFEYAATFHYYSGSGSGDPSYAYVTINLKQQMTCVPGPVRCKLELSKTGGDFFTAPFILMVDAAGLADDVDISETVLPDYIDAAQRAAQEAASYVDSSEAWARGTRNGTPVSQSDETYHNNSKYYSEQSAAQVSLAAEQVTLAAAQVTLAQAQATAAAGSATSASNSATAAADEVKNAEAYARGTRNNVPVGSSDVTYHNNSKYYSEQAAGSAQAAAASVAQGTQVRFWVSGGILYVQQTIEGVVQPAVALGSVTSPNTDYKFATVADMNTAIANDEVIPNGMCYVAEDTGSIWRNEAGTAVRYGINQTIGSRASGSAVGTDSLAVGVSNTATGNASSAQGYYCTASQAGAHAEGYNTEASGACSHAEGGVYQSQSDKTTASGTSSHAEGAGTTASGNRSHAEGYKTEATANCAHAEGLEGKATAEGAHVEGGARIASGRFSHAEGNYTEATASTSHAEGSSSVASGMSSHAEGSQTTSGGAYSHAEGYKTTASGQSAHAEGSESTASGDLSHAEGRSTAYQRCHSEGYLSVAGDSSVNRSSNICHAEGYKTTATGDYGAHAEGNETTASGYKSHAEGGNTEASGEGSHAEGGGTVASAVNSHAEGGSTTASGARSHAEGAGSTASGAGAHAEGAATASGTFSHAEGQYVTASGDYSHAEGNGTSTVPVEASGIGAHAEGSQTKAYANYSHAEGISTAVYGYSSHGEGQNAVIGDANTQATKFHGCHAEGSDTSISYTGSSGNGLFGAHVEGYNSRVTCSSVLFAAHAEGTNTLASAGGAHSEGAGTVASGSNSHAEGTYTIASADSQHAGGKYNVEKSAAGNYMVIGNGTDDNARSNCFRVYTTAVYGNGAYNSSGADYAEYFEWLDGNESAEDRAGRFVTLAGDKIRLATAEDDFILGIVSGNASVIGDSHDDQWAHMYERDIFGRFIFEDVEIPAITEQIDEDHTEILVPAHMEHRLKLNPAYDNTQIYLPRSQRSEWDAVGMVGKLVALDDGTCQVNDYCAPGDDGIATASEDKTRYRVIKRLGEYHIQIVIV